MSEAIPKILSTKKYELFGMLDENRPVDVGSPRRRRLMKSMQKSGWIRELPMLCVRNNNRLFVKDGQHRLAIARELGIQVWYVVIESGDIDVRTINGTQTPWNFLDYGGSFAAQGKSDYAEAMHFAKEHGIAASTAAALLIDHNSVGEISNQWKNGTFRIANRKGADIVAEVFSFVRSLNKQVGNRYMLCAIQACCLVPSFDTQRFMKAAERHPEMLAKYGSRDGYLDMIQRIYNFGRSIHFPLRIEAENALRRRMTTRGAFSATKPTQAAKTNGNGAPPKATVRVMNNVVPALYANA